MEKHNGTYRDLHRPASEFATRDEYLEHELQIMQPKRWRPNLPFRDYRFEWEDLIPAMAGTIGKVVMVGAVAAAFAAPLGLPDSFVLENVRYELLIAAAFILIGIGLFSARRQPARYARAADSDDSHRCVGRRASFGVRHFDCGFRSADGFISRRQYYGEADKQRRMRRIITLFGLYRHDGAGKKIVFVGRRF